MKTKTRNAQKRLQYLNRNGMNEEGLLQMEQDDKEVCTILNAGDEEIQKQLQYNRINNSRYSDYLNIYVEKGTNSQSLLTRARCGSL